MKYPIGIQSFDQIIEGNWVYVDKYRFGLSFGNDDQNLFS